METKMQNQYENVSLLANDIVKKPRKLRASSRLKWEKLDLLEDYRATGTDLQSFIDEVYRLDATTEVIQLDTFKNVTFYSVKGKNSDGSVDCHVINMNTLRYFDAGVFRKTLLPLKHAEQLKEETASNEQSAPKSASANLGSGLFLLIDDRIYYVSIAALTTLGIRADMKGTRLAKPSLWRDLYLYTGLINCENSAKLIIRSDYPGGNKSNTIQKSKVLSVLSDKFKLMPLSTLAIIANRIINERVMGETVVRKWETTHRLTKLYLEFPEYALKLKSKTNGKFDMIPGLLLKSSNTGDAAFSVKKTLRSQMSDFCTTQEGLAKKHSAEIDPNIVYDYLANKYEREIEDVVRAYAEKSNKLIYKSSLILKSDVRNNRKQCEEIIRKWMKEFGLLRLLGRKRYAVVDVLVTEDIIPSHPYSEYDIAQFFMTIPDVLIRNNMALPLDRLEDLQDILYGLSNARCSLNENKDNSDDFLIVDTERNEDFAEVDTQWANL